MVWFMKLSQDLSGGTEESHGRSLSGWPAYGPKCGPGTSRIRSRHASEFCMLVIKSLSNWTCCLCCLLLLSWVDPFISLPCYEFTCPAFVSMKVACIIPQQNVNQTFRRCSQCLMYEVWLKGACKPFISCVAISQNGTPNWGVCGSWK
jgi:hypothetical protein